MKLIRNRFGERKILGRDAFPGAAPCSGDVPPLSAMSIFAVLHCWQDWCAACCVVLAIALGVVQGYVDTGRLRLWTAGAALASLGLFCYLALRRCRDSARRRRTPPPALFHSAPTVGGGSVASALADPGLPGRDATAEADPLSTLLAGAQPEALPAGMPPPLHAPGLMGAVSPSRPL